MNNGIVLSHPGCGPFVQQAARGLYEAGLLKEYVTTFQHDAGNVLNQLLNVALRPIYSHPQSQLERRCITEVPAALIRSHPFPELLRMAALNFGPIAGDIVWEHTEKWFDRIVARKHLRHATAVYGYEHACLETFRRQRARGGVCIYDMPICHHATTDRWLAAEYAKYPELTTAYDRHRARLSERRNRRKDAELVLADCVIVASNFVRDSLVRAGTPAGKLRVLPSGAPPVQTAYRSLDASRFVFLVAGHLSVRKGTHYVLSAWRKLSPPANVELWLVGQWQLPESLRQDLPGTVLLCDTLPRDDLYRLFDRANVLLFPTLAEGLALTPLQAGPGASFSGTEEAPCCISAVKTSASLFCQKRRCPILYIAPKCVPCARTETDCTCTLAAAPIIFPAL